MDIGSIFAGLSTNEEEEPENPLHAALIVGACNLRNVCEKPATLEHVDNWIALHEELGRRLADLRAQVAAG